MKLLKIFSIIFVLGLISIFGESDWQGDYYNENSSVQYFWAKGFLNKIEDRLSGEILDLGCGDGKITYEIAKNHPECNITGVDPSPSMIETAKKKYKLSNLSFLVGDAQNLKFDKRFDYVISFSCFHWIVDQNKALRSINSVLKESGKVCLFFAPKSDAKDRLDKSLGFVMGKSRWKNLLAAMKHDFTLVYPSDFEKMLVNANFIPFHIKEVKTHFVFKNRGSFKNWMKGWLPHAKVLAKNNDEEFMDEVIDQYLTKHPLDENGRFHYYDYMLEIVAQKKMVFSN